MKQKELKWTRVLKALDKYDLGVPEAFYCCDIDVFEEVVNGCGPKGIVSRIAPDKFLFVSVVAACYIHDFEYSIGKTKKDKKTADIRFRRNMLKIVNSESKFFLFKWLRRGMCWDYFRLVKNFGDDAFKDHDEREVLLAPCK